MVKELYLTPENILKKSEDFLLSTAHCNKKGKGNFILQKAACLVIDLQKYFCDSRSHAFIPSVRAIIPNVKKLASLFIQHERPLLFTRHLNTPQNAGNMLRWWRDIIQKEDPLSNLVEELQELRGKVLTKTRYDAFYKTPLQEILEKEGVEQLVITGVMTHLCCETTIRSAFNHGYEIYFPVDATADYNEDFHRASLLNLAHGFAVPVSTSDLSERVQYEQ